MNLTPILCEVRRNLEKKGATKTCVSREKLYLSSPYVFQVAPH